MASSIRIWLKKHWWFGTLVISLLTIVAGHFVIQNFDLSVLLSLRVSTLIILFLLFALSTLIYLFPVWLLLHGMGYLVSPLSLYMVLHVSFAMNYTSPVKIGIPLRVYLYKHLLRVPYSSGTAAVTIMNSIWLLVLSMLSLLGVQYVVQGYSPWYYLLAVAMVVVVVAVLLFFPFDSLSRFVGRLPFQELSIRLLAFAERIQGYIRRTSIWTTSVAGVTVFLKLYVTALASHLVLRDFGYQLGSSYILAAQSTSLLLGLISMIPMGIGTRDVSMVLLLGQRGIPQDVAVALALVERMVWTLLPFLLGLVAANYLGIRLFARIESGIDQEGT